MRPPRFWQTGGWPGALLMPLALVVTGAARLRRRLTRQRRAAVPVLCIGNVTVGGAGKTPVAQDLGGRLVSAGRAVHFVTRGYGGRPGRTPLRVDPTAHDAARVGDEALLLARVAPTWIAPDRVAGARAAALDGAEVVILDDGFQNPRLAYDRAMLVVDREVGLGNGRVMPAGPLREPLSDALARADALVPLGSADGRAGPTQGMARGIPCFPAEVVATEAAERLAGQRVVAFAGLARPDKLFATLRACGADVVDTAAFPDHHPYSRADLERLAARARELDARLVTTRKDAVRLPPAYGDRVETVDVRVGWRDPAAVDRFLEGLFPS